MRLDIQTLNDHGFLILNNFFEQPKLEPIHSNIQSILSNVFPNNLPKMLLMPNVGWPENPNCNVLKIFWI